MWIDENGWCSQIQKVPSLHFNDRPLNEKITMIVIHSISLPAGCFGTCCVKDLFLGCLDCSYDSSFVDLKDLKVSSHFYIDRKGLISQFVSCQKRAWHAGVSSFRNRQNCNDFSIGIELEGTDFVAFEPVQYQKLSELCKVLSTHYPITSIVGHSDIAPGRKTDPGPFFNWKELKHLGPTDAHLYPFQVDD